MLTCFVKFSCGQSSEADFGRLRVFWTNDESSLAAVGL